MQDRHTLYSARKGTLHVLGIIVPSVQLEAIKLTTCGQRFLSWAWIVNSPLLLPGSYYFRISRVAPIQHPQSLIDRSQIDDHRMWRTGNLLTRMQDLDVSFQPFLKTLACHCIAIFFLYFL